MFGWNHKITISSAIPLTFIVMSQGMWRSGIDATYINEMRAIYWVPSGDAMQRSRRARNTRIEHNRDERTVELMTRNM